MLECVRERERELPWASYYTTRLLYNIMVVHWGLVAMWTRMDGCIYSAKQPKEPTSQITYFHSLSHKIILKSFFALTMNRSLSIPVRPSPPFRCLSHSVRLLLLSCHRRLMATTKRSMCNEMMMRMTTTTDGDSGHRRRLHCHTAIVAMA